MKIVIANLLALTLFLQNREVVGDVEEARLQLEYTGTPETAARQIEHVVDILLDVSYQYLQYSIALYDKGYDDEVIEYWDSLSEKHFDNIMSISQYFGDRNYAIDWNLKTTDVGSEVKEDKDYSLRTIGAEKDNDDKIDYFSPVDDLETCGTYCNNTTPTVDSIRKIIHKSMKAEQKLYKALNRVITYVYDDKEFDEGEARFVVTKIKINDESIEGFLASIADESIETHKFLTDMDAIVKMAASTNVNTHFTQSEF